MSYTRDQVVTALQQLPKDERNPQEDGMSACLYTTEEGDHCVIGAMLVVLGIAPPAFGSEYNTECFGCTPHATKFDSEANVLISHVQVDADENVPWGIAIGRHIET